MDKKIMRIKNSNSYQLKSLHVHIPNNGIYLFTTILLLLSDTV